MPYKLGKKPPVRTLRTMRLAIAMARALDPLGAPPPKPNNYIGAVSNTDCPMFGNDDYGDCVSADTAHMLMVRSANTGLRIIPTLQNVFDLYSAVSSPPFNPSDPSTDNGLAEVDMLAYLKGNGFLGHKLDMYASVDPSNLDHIKWCVQLFGGCRIGVNLPQSCMDQFDANQPWTVSGDLTLIGGHDVPIVDYDQDYFYVCTWGRWRQPVTPQWLVQFCDEAHPELAFDWVAKQGVAPSGLDLNDLENKIQIAMATPDPTGTVVV